MSCRTLVVVLNWNGTAYTRRCLESLARQTTRQFEVLVIDNGSAEPPRHPAGLPDWMRVKLLRLPCNVGFAEGMNIGFRHAVDRGFEYSWLLNQDTNVHADCLERLVGAAERGPEDIVATPELVDRDGAQMPVGGYIDWAEAQLRPLVSFDEADRARGAWLTGTAMLVRTRGCPERALFDPGYFAYWEDVDLSTRVLARGGALVVVRGAVVQHLKPPYTRWPWDMPPEIHYLSMRNALVFFRRHTPRQWRRRAMLKFAAFALRQAGFAHQGGCTAAAAAMLQGLKAGLRLETGPPPRMVGASLVGRQILQHFWGLNRSLEKLADWPDGMAAGFWRRRSTEDA